MIGMILVSCHDQMISRIFLPVSSSDPVGGSRRKRKPRREGRRKIRKFSSNATGLSEIAEEEKRQKSFELRIRRSVSGISWSIQYFFRFFLPEYCQNEWIMITLAAIETLTWHDNFLQRKENRYLVLDNGFSPLYLLMILSFFMIL